MHRAVLVSLVAVMGLAAWSGAAEVAPNHCDENARDLGRAALSPCRDALAAVPDDPRLIRMVAELEFQYGDPERSVDLWGALVKQDWQTESARGLAMALARSGESEEAEAEFRRIVERAPSEQASLDLIRFLLTMNRPAEAARSAEEKVTEFPANCELEEAWGEALAATGDDGAAAEHFERAGHKACPPFRWARIGQIPQRLDESPYRELLDSTALVAGLDDLDDGECRVRFELLRITMVPEVAPQVTDQVLDRHTSEVRLAGIGLLAVVGSRAAASWDRLLRSEDFVLRKRALRHIRQLHDPGFIPLLEDQLEREPLPGNRSLTALALGELLVEGEESARGVALLEGIPASDVSYPTARMTLLERAEADGDIHAAARYLLDIRSVAPDFWIDPEREARLRAGARLPIPTTVPADPERKSPGIE